MSVLAHDDTVSDGFSFHVDGGAVLLEDESLFFECGFYVFAVHAVFTG